MRAKNSENLTKCVKLSLLPTIMITLPKPLYYISHISSSLKSGGVILVESYMENPIHRDIRFNILPIGFLNDILKLNLVSFVGIKS